MRGLYHGVNRFLLSPINTVQGPNQVKRPCRWLRKARLSLLWCAEHTPPVEPFVLACQDSGAVPTLRMAADHGEFAFGSPHQTMQICGLGRDACGKATGCKPPTVVEALGISFDYKREEAFAQSG